MRIELAGRRELPPGLRIIAGEVGDPCEMHAGEGFEGAVVLLPIDSAGLLVVLSRR